LESEQENVREVDTELSEKSKPQEVVRFSMIIFYDIFVILMDFAL